MYWPGVVKNIPARRWRSLKSSIPLLALAACLAAGCQIKTKETVISSGGGSIPYAKMGLNMFPRNRTAGPLADQMNDIRSLGVRYIRVNFWFDSAYMSGPGAQPDFTQFDEMVDAADGAGLEILGVLAPVPSWLRGSGDWKAVYAEKFVTPTVSRYKARVKYWEVWNEPDEDAAMFDGTPESYFELLKPASAAIKSADPEAKVVAAAPVNIVSKGGAKFAWLEKLVTLGLRQYAAVLNFHYYSNLDMTLGVSGKALMEKAAMPLWVTETGIIGQDRQLDYFKKNLPYIENALNPERIYWYCYIQGEGEHEETHPADTYGIVTMYNGQRFESPVYALLKSH